MRNATSAQWAFLIVFVLFIYLLLWPLFQVFLGPLIFGAILASALFPLYKRLKKRLRLSPMWVAGIVCFLSLVVIVFPLAYILIQLSKEIIYLYEHIRETLADQNIREFLFGQGMVAGLVKKVSKLLGFSPDPLVLQTELTAFLQKYAGKVVGPVSGWIGNTFGFLFGFLMMILFSFIFLAEGENLRQFFYRLIPIPEDEKDLMIRRFADMNNATIVAGLLAGLVQGISAGLVLWFAGIHSIVLWSTLMTVLALIPFVGISFFYIPACIYLFIKGSTVAAIVSFVVCLCIALAGDNWLKVKLIGDKVKINPLLLFFSILGALSAFGVAGIFYGPLIVILFLTLAEIYHKNYAPQ
jgi:predicted PurR-regulated permease PerM